MDGKEKIVTIAKSIIIHYIRQNYSDKSNINEEIERINEIFKGLDISFDNRIPGSPTQATNFGNGKISLRFNDKDNISKEELENMIETVVHEIYHSISKMKIGEIFLEEGFVSYITAETVRYSIDNPIEIPGVAKPEELKRVLEKQDLENGYRKPSEIVRSIQLIMEQYGVDSKYEYIFNGIDRLKEIAYQINPELQNILELQKRKETNSQTLKLEENFFKKAFEQIDYSNLSPTLVEMNQILQKYLIKSGEINKNPKVYDIVNKFNPTDVAYQQFCLKAKDMSDEEIAAIMQAELPQEQIDYELDSDMIKTIQQMSKIVKMYRESTSPVKPATCGAVNFYSILIAYDLLQKGTDMPTQDDIMKYCNYLVYNANTENLTVSTIQNYMEYVRTKTAEGKDLNQILNIYLTNSAIVAVNMDRICESDLPAVEKFNELSDIVLHQSEDEQEYFYDYYFAMLLKTQKQQVDKNRVYDEKDYDEFLSQMQEILNYAQFPNIMSEIGYTPEVLFMKSISEILEITSENFSEQINNLLKIINKRNPNLGDATGRLDDFGFNISKAYEKIKESENSEMRKDFLRNLVKAYYKDGYKSNLRKATSREVRKRNVTFFLPNKNIEQTVQDIISDPEFYQDLNDIKDLFDKNPQIYKMVSLEKSFIKMLVQQLPDEMQNQINSKAGKSLGLTDINNAIFGSSFPKTEQFMNTDLGHISPLVQFAVKYDKYQELIKDGKKEEAEKLFLDKPVLDYSTVIIMAKRQDVQMCNIDAQEAFNNIDLNNRKKEEKDISL